MSSPYDLITITLKDLEVFEKSWERSKIGIILHIIFDELPEHLKKEIPFLFPSLQPIEGFEDEHVRGYEISIVQNGEIEDFVRDYVPFFILKK